MALPPPFPTTPKKSKLFHHPGLQDELDALSRKPLFAQAGVAIADLSGQYSRCAGWNEYKPRYSGSLLKVVALLAALQLREQLNLAPKGLKKEELFQQVTDAWYPKVSRSVPGPANFPQLDKMFEFKSDGEVEFNFKFAGKLGMMASLSHAESSEECIQHLGHQYINGLLASELLYTAKSSGLWLGGDYGNHEYAAVPGLSTHYGATPSAMMRLLDLLNSDQLISLSGSRKMKRLMENFWMLDYLKTTGRQFLNTSETFGKLGRGKVGSVMQYFDAGVVSRLHKDGNFRYAFVILGLPSDQLRELALALDDIIVKFHHESAKTPVGRHTFD